MLDPKLEQEHNGYTFIYRPDFELDKEGNVFCNGVWTAEKADDEGSDLHCTNEEIEWLKTCEATMDYIQTYYNEIVWELQDKLLHDKIEW